MQEEIWKDIGGYEGVYQISNLGRVKSFKFNSEKVLINKTSSNYDMVALCLNGVVKYFTNHRLVAIAFLHNPENKEQVNHKNGIKSDNRLENLEWCTRSENTSHAIRIGLMKHPTRGKLGKDNFNSKVVIQYSLDGVYVNKYFGASEASRMTNISMGNISSCCLGNRNKAGGYKWKYKQ